MRHRNYSQFWLFLLGLGSATKVYLGGVIALSEIVVFSIAPIVFVRHYREYKHDGFIPVICLSFLMIIGSCISCIYNGAGMLAWIKTVMMFYSIPAAIIVYYSLLKGSFKGIGWFFLGLALSQIVAVFIFNPHIMTDGRSVEVMSAASVEEQMEGVMFWYTKINRFLLVPVQGWYLKIPIVFSAAAPVAAAFVALLTSVSGRSAAASALLSSAVIGIVGKSRKRMRAIGRHIFVGLVLIVFMAIGIKTVYSHAAKSGYLGEEALRKYNAQTHGNDSFMSILMGGRVEFFIAIRAMLDHPFIGVGPYAVDEKGYTQSFLLKYGDAEDYEIYLRGRLARQSAVELIPQHSTLTQFWGLAGLSGLVFCLYYLHLIYLYFRKYSWCIPQWFGYVVLAVPSSLFSLFFNPYTERMVMPLLIVCLLFVRAVGKGLIMLPVEMEREAQKYG